MTSLNRMALDAIDELPVSPSSATLSDVELELLAHLEAANRALEQDQKSVKTVSPESTRHNSADSVSIRSLSSLSSQTSGLPADVDGTDGSLTAEDEVVGVWSRLLSEWETASKKRPQYIKELVHKGVPHQFRCLVWQHLCGADHSPVKEKYSDYLKQTSACEKVIRRDIARTYPEHEFFREKDGIGQESLFNVMKAYSLHDREVGYCQGSGFIVGLLLMLMPEEEAFTVLVQLMREYRLRELYKPTMAELGLCMYQLEFLIQENLPSLYQHFQAQSFYTSMYASSWFLTLFTTNLPLSLCFRIMDVFLSEGMEIIFRMAVAILTLGEADLLCLDMEGMLVYFQEKVPKLYDSGWDALLETALRLSCNTKQLKKLEKEYSLLKAKENEDQIELRRLRSENRLLRQRIENLEKENVTLADRLIQGQVTRAQEAEDMFVVKRELSQLREQNSELSRSLAASNQQIMELKVPSHRGGAQFYKRSLSMPCEEGLYNHVRDLHLALNDLHRSMSAVGEESKPSENLQSLQEELIAVKLREAESNLALRELTNHVSDLDREWQKQLERTPRDKLSKTQSQYLHEELMTVKLREAEAVTQNKHLKLKVMELETAGQITGNQLQRLLDDNERLRGQVAESKEQEQILHSELEDLKNRLSNLDTKSKEDAMVSKINDVEHSQMVAELRQRIAELEIRNQEFLVTNQIIHQPGQQNLQNEIADLKDELFQLQRSPMSFSTLDLRKGDFDSASEGDESDANNLALALTASMTSSLTNGFSKCNASGGKILVAMEMDSPANGY